MSMKSYAIFALPFVLTVGAVPAISQATDPVDAAGTRLSEVIDRAMHEDGPIILPEEHAAIERACGYESGGWDGDNISMTDGVLICSNGRRVDDPEIRAMVGRISERAGRLVSSVMARTDVAEALQAVASLASDRALRQLGAEGVIPRPRR